MRDRGDPGDGTGRPDPAGAGAGPGATRWAVLQAVLTRPGTSIQDVADALDVDHSTVRHHVRVLREEGAVERIRDGRIVRLFVRGAGLAERLAPILRDPDRGRVLDYLRDHPVPTVTINRVADALGLHFRVVRRTMEWLDRVGVIEMTRDEGGYRLREVRDLGDLMDRSR